MKKMLVLIILILMIVITAPPSHAFIWMVYHKPAFKGKIIDAETKEPIEGAVVVAMYNKSTIGLGAGTLSSIINVREAMTDKDGMFRIPSYTTVIQPFSWEISATFIIFKPGYGSFPNYHVSPPKLGVNPEVFFSTGKIGEEGETGWEEFGRLTKVTFGIVELPKLKTREEREKARMAADIFGAEISTKDLPLLYKAINEERKSGF